MLVCVHGRFSRRQSLVTPISRPTILLGISHNTFELPSLFFLKHDANHLLHNILIEHALQYNPLLYAVVGFVAFQSSVTRADGKIQDFLCYYKNSVSLLGKSLVENQKNKDATMWTILQLATVEVRGTTNLPSRADNVQRITWAIGSACLAIKKLPMACF